MPVVHLPARRPPGALPVAFATLVCLAATARTAGADTPLRLRSQWSGAVQYFASGVPLAVDGSDTGNDVDALSQPATITVLPTDVPAGATLLAVYLYWGGTIPDSGCNDGALLDDSVDLIPAGQRTPWEVYADDCFCSTAGVSGYDMQVCVSDVTETASRITGSWRVDGFDAQIRNRSTDNASAALVVVYEHPDEPERRVALYDGLQTLERSTATVALTGVEVDATPEGSLTWYALEGDKNPTTVAGFKEQVTVHSRPSGRTLTLSDANNPADNPMNATINTTSPPRTNTYGVDIDTFDISEALAPRDTSVTVEFETNSDKYWLAFNLVSVRAHAAVLGRTSAKTVELVGDVNGDGLASPGDTVRYTLSLENTGLDRALVDLEDPISPLLLEPALVASGGATLEGGVLRVNDLGVDVGARVTISFEARIADVEDETRLTNVASFDARPDGDAGQLVAPELVVRRDRDGDRVFDHDDNCPDVPNPRQTDFDQDGVGDPCDDPPPPFCASEGGDADNDGVCQELDNCPDVANADQLDADMDGIGDACDGTGPAPGCETRGGDTDGDGVCDLGDNCPRQSNAAQEDLDGDGIGDACDGCGQDPDNDRDRDGVCAPFDNCPLAPNTTQADVDEDDLGDACDPCPTDASNDGDEDGLCAPDDNCPEETNADQADADGDDVGDVCDACPADPDNDVDGDGHCADADNCPTVANAVQADGDQDGVGDACDDCPDADHDGACDDVDDCPNVPSETHDDVDGDGLGDACDPCPKDPNNDEDRDGFCGNVDLCPTVYDPSQTDANGNGFGDACELSGLGAPASNCGCRVGPTARDASPLDGLLTLALAAWVAVRARRRTTRGR